MTTVTQNRGFELVSTVTFHDLPIDELGSFAQRLARSVGAVLPEYPAVIAFVVEPEDETGDINFGLRFRAIDPTYVEGLASEILAKAVSELAKNEGTEPIEAEREESVLVLTR
jgi:hypothetical protein